MKKEEAKMELITGKKMTHRLFASDEYVYLKGDKIFGEDGDSSSATGFWSSMEGTQWELGWNIFIEQKRIIIN